MAEAAAAHQVDRSTIMRIRTVAKETTKAGLLDLLDETGADWLHTLMLVEGKDGWG